MKWCDKHLLTKKYRIRIFVSPEEIINSFEYIENELLHKSKMNKKRTEKYNQLRKKFCELYEQMEKKEEENKEKKISRPRCIADCGNKSLTRIYFSIRG